MTKILLEIPAEIHKFIKEKGMRFNSVFLFGYDRMFINTELQDIKNIQNTLRDLQNIVQNLQNIVQNLQNIVQNLPKEIQDLQKETQNLSKEIQEIKKKNIEISSRYWILEQKIESFGLIFKK